MSEPYQPLSVRTGQRAPLPYHEGVPSHLQSELLDAVRFGAAEADGGDVASLMVLELQIPQDYSGADPMDRIVSYCQASSENFLDALDYVLACQRVYNLDPASASGIIGEVFLSLELGGSVWRVVIDPVAEDQRSSGPAWSYGSKFRAGLRRRVPVAEEDLYLSALDSQGGAPGHLRTAWHAAYGRPAEPLKAWQSAIKAVEAALQPIVEPDNPAARLGAMRSKILQGRDNFRCELPIWANADADDPVEAFTQALSRVTYEPARHGASEQDWTPEQAQAVLGQAVTICEWIRLGIFARAGEPSAGQ
ncbi:hypothetical protein JRG18_12620 [Kocuria palustris]|uniref:hypothetical protein n=1 Tax=Kocuria palustris TaxID=71999 RepID=UPI0019D0A406|nr:hypothetical protein [Kocuria palustris]MBN6754328.1 hypothetical protein [Kocuria palustris]MBN6759297.1 hypothetical protein [Kocuria palustris]MBN6764309.1 hypothetical protein [Kocuria palustris]MBN6783808.1 hypothetical protein [Kocuria palustris]MBN6800276.1 hypothetical protein [Kocuria palustris]